MTEDMTWRERRAAKVLARFAWKQKMAADLRSVEERIAALQAGNEALQRKLAKQARKAGKLGG